MKGLAEHQKATQLWQKGKRSLALKNHAKACKLNPEQAVFARHYAFALSSLHQHEAAKKQMQRALELSCPDTNTTLETCVAARDAKLYDLLYTFLHGKELPAPLKYFYADSLNRRGEKAAALELIQGIPSATRLQHPYLQLLLAQLQDRAQQTNAALETAASISTETLPPPLRAELHYTRAAIHDHLADSHSAFQELRQAKSILKKQAEPSAQHSQLARQLNHAVLPTASPLRKPTKTPPIVLCGHPRSGTTLIEQVLDSHPSVTSVEEEDCFFSQAAAPLHTAHKTPELLANYLQSSSNKELQSYRANYLEKLHSYCRESEPASLTVDKFPDLSTTLGLYRKILPDAKIIVALRDPRDVVLSCYFQNLPLNNGSIPYLDLQTTAQKYINTLETWLESKVHFQDGWIETRYEDWVLDTEREAKRVIEFLELEWNPAVLDFHKRNKTVSSPTFADVSRPIYKGALGRWKKYEEQLSPVLEKLHPICEKLGYTP